MSISEELDELEERESAGAFDFSEEAEFDD